jgi:ribosomal protein L11
MGLTMKQIKKIKKILLILLIQVIILHKKAKTINLDLVMENLMREINKLQREKQHNNITQLTNLQLEKIEEICEIKANNMHDIEKLFNKFDNVNKN